MFGKTNKLTVILGAGESGTGAALLAKQKGLEVFVSDSGIIAENYRLFLKKENIEFEEGRHNTQKILAASEIIKSPGIPDSAEPVRKASEKGIRIISEIEFAGRYTDAPKICITGSNGKSTTASLIWHIFNEAGKNYALGGNIGKSFARLVAEDKYEGYILEISSFQLDNMYDFKADTAILLNITPDHLDRYDNDFQNYIDSKMRITQNQSENDIVIFNTDDKIVQAEIALNDVRARLYPFSHEKSFEQGAYIRDEILTVKTEKNSFSMNTDNLSIMGLHNQSNSMAAAITARLNDIRSEELKESFKSFKGIEHRLENYIKVGGIRFINDSKSTNVNSTWYALQSVTGKVVLILGGIDGGNEYDILMDLVRKKVIAIVCLGIDNKKIKDAFIGTTELYEASTMKEAVEKAYKLAKDGETVLLSPACKSFDLFNNFEERGNSFKEAVHEL